MSIHAAMADACAAVGIKPPRYTKPGAWVQTQVDGKSAANKSGRVMIFDDERGGVVWNWATGESLTFRLDGANTPASAPRRDPEADRQRGAERLEVARICEALVRAATPEPHPYLAAKGFPDELGLVLADPRATIPATDMGQRIARALPETAEPVLIIPGRIGKRVTTVQFITVDGTKKNILGGQMGGSAHRIATGRETWVAEGIATALSVRAALRLLGRSATVLSAFSASNVAKVATGIRGAIIAADHDKPIEALDGLGTGEYYARQSGCRWTQPPMRGDFNDMHARDSLRAVALHLRTIRGG